MAQETKGQPPKVERCQTCGLPPPGHPYCPVCQKVHKAGPENLPPGLEMDLAARYSEAAPATLYRSQEFRFPARISGGNDCHVILNETSGIHRAAKSRSLGGGYPKCKKRQFHPVQESKLYRRAEMVKNRLLR